MPNRRHDGFDKSVAAPGPAQPDRKLYQPPRLVTFGDVRDRTLGSTPGIGDSGNPTIFRP